MQQINNIQPRTRAEREAMKDKESIEKFRINERVGYESRHLDARDLIHNSNPQSDLYCPENERFDKDFANYDKYKREEDKIKKEMQLEKLRIQRLERESDKWQKISQQDEFDQKKREFQGDVLMSKKRNANGLPFNPITLEYEKNQEGQSLKYQDENKQIRGFARSHNLDVRSNCGYNVLTGETRSGIQVPEEFKERYDSKLNEVEAYYSLKLQKKN